MIINPLHHPPLLPHPTLQFLILLLHQSWLIALLFIHLASQLVFHTNYHLNLKHCSKKNNNN